MLKIKLVNDQVALNNYFNVEAKEYIPGDVVKVKFQILDPQLNVRVIPGTAATMSVIFQKTDGTTLTKSASMLFNPDDRSMWMVALTALESQNIVGSNFQVVLDMLGDTTDVRQGMAYNVLSKITYTGD